MVLSVKSSAMVTPDGEKCLVTDIANIHQEISDVEDRFTFFFQESSTDQNITQQKFAFKFNSCKIREGPIRENVLVQMLRKGAQTLDIKCPYLAGMVLSTVNQTFDDSLLPPFPNEIYARLHKETYGKLKGAKKWLKLFSEDWFLRIKK
jgi:hypothetical protein